MGQIWQPDPLQKKSRGLLILRTGARLHRRHIVNRTAVIGDFSIAVICNFPFRNPPARALRCVGGMGLARNSAAIVFGHQISFHRQELRALCTNALAQSAPKIPESRAASAI